MGSGPDELERFQVYRPVASVEQLDELVRGLSSSSARLHFAYEYVRVGVRRMGGWRVRENEKKEDENRRSDDGRLVAHSHRVSRSFP